MTWHHVALIILASIVVLACGLSPQFPREAMKDVIAFSTTLVVGAIGHAGNNMRRQNERSTDRPAPTEKDTRG